MTTFDENNRTPRYAPPVDLSKFAWLSIAAAVVTIGLKGGAAWLTGSVGLLSDAAESLVNLVAAIVALIALKVAIRPPDESHPYGFSKAEYFSAAVEGVMIFAAAAFTWYPAEVMDGTGIRTGMDRRAQRRNGPVSAQKPPWKE